MARVQVLKTRGYCFTLNNYTDDDQASLRALDFRYLTYGREVGANGTKHLQGYIHFRCPRSFTSVKRLVPRWHVEPRNGTIQQAVVYCHKDGDFEEFGDVPSPEEGRKKGGEANKERWKTITAKARKGDLSWVELNEPQVFVQFGSRLESLRVTKPPNLEGELENEWWVGPTGTGKSRLLWELYPDHFSKRLNKWWDGYQRQDIVAIEEWSPKNDVTGSSLKIWADRYVFDGEVKGGTLMHLRPKKIIVLSNYTIEQCFSAVEDREPIRRRFREIKFPDEKPWARQRGLDFIASNEVIPVIDSSSQDLDDVDLFGISDDLLTSFLD